MVLGEAEPPPPPPPVQSPCLKAMLVAEIAEQQAGNFITEVVLMSLLNPSSLCSAIRRGRLIFRQEWPQHPCAALHLGLDLHTGCWIFVGLEFRNCSFL